MKDVSYGNTKLSSELVCLLSGAYLLAKPVWSFNFAELFVFIVLNLFYTAKQK